MNFGDAVRSGLNNYATFAGRARRSEFWWFWLFNILAQAVAGLLDTMIFWDIRPIGGLVGLVLLLPNLAMGARRLHDTDHSGWWLLLAFLPVIGSLILLFWFVSRGNDGPNRFGADPRGGWQDMTGTGGPAGGQGGSALPPRAPQGGAGRPWPVNPR
jgi:uncharacterized membrane protein YhaH (DUF805 family)